MSIFSHIAQYNFSQHALLGRAQISLIISKESLLQTFVLYYWVHCLKTYVLTGSLFTFSKIIHGLFFALCQHEMFFVRMLVKIGYYSTVINTERRVSKYRYIWNGQIHFECVQSCLSPSCEHWTHTLYSSLHLFWVLCNFSMYISSTPYLDIVIIYLQCVLPFTTEKVKGRILPSYTFFEYKFFVKMSIRNSRKMSMYVDK